MNPSSAVTAAASWEQKVQALENELAKTNRGMVALIMELEQRIERQAAELRAAHAELEATNSELMRITLELEDRVTRRTAELHAANDLLRTSEERLRLAVEYANDIVYEWDLRQNLQWFGRIDELLGYAEGEFPRTLEAWFAVVHPEDRPKVEAAVAAHLERQVPYSTEYRVRQKNGSYRWWSARGAVTRSAAGVPLRWIGTVTDITDRKFAEGTLRKHAAELLLQNDRLNAFHRIAVGRELRMIELKREVDELCHQFGLAIRYHHCDESADALQAAGTAEAEDRTHR